MSIATKLKRALTPTAMSNFIKSMNFKENKGKEHKR
jgi:hypothetical protein